LVKKKKKKDILETCSSAWILIVHAAHSLTLLWTSSATFVQVKSPFRKVGRQASPEQKAYELSCGTWLCDQKSNIIG